MHMAPCTKASISMGRLALMRLISSRESSLATLIRLTPWLFQKAAARLLVVLAWVLRCSGISGISSWALSTIPGSDTISPSGCRCLRKARKSSSAG
jgi:hypothetical protein